MALRVWLPLNGSLENRGLSNASFAVSGTTAYTDGKIGKCLSCNGSSFWYTDNFSIGNTWSIAVWAKTSTGNKMPWVISTASSDRLNLYCNSYYSLNIGDGNGNLFKTDAGGSITVYTDGKWHHFVVVFNGSEKAKLYIDGAYAGQATTYRDPTMTNARLRIAGGYGNAHSYDWNGGINDFRIYDEALSPLQVKEISQGLILHYKLDGFSGGAPDNIVLHSKTLDIAPSQTNRYIRNRSNSTLIARSDGFTEIRVTNSWGGTSVWANMLDLKVGDICTYSFIAYQTGGVAPAYISFYPMMFNSGGSRDTSTALPIYTSTSGEWVSANARNFYITVPTTPTLYWCAFEWNSAVKSIIDNGGRIELTIQGHGTFPSGEYIYIYAPKIERGFNPHPAWSPAPEDVGVDMTKVADSSGYGHDGIITGTLYSVTDNTSKNGVATMIPSGANYIDCGESRSVLPTDAVTVSMWINHSTWGNPISCTEGGGWNFESSDAGIRFPVNISGVGYKYMGSGVSYSTLANSWHMLTGTFDRATVKIYIDGELKGSVDTGSTNGIAYAANHCYVGAEAAGGSSVATTSYVGKVSDVRIYATALSADDIKALYNTGLRVDNGHAMHSHALRESCGDILAGCNLVTPFGSASNPKYTGYNSEGEITLTGTGTSIGSTFIPIDPTGKTFYWDATYSVTDGDSVYIGFERYDANKTSRTNQATTYVVSGVQTGRENHYHAYGTVNLSTDTVNPAAFIRLRILNGWYSTSGTLTIHQLSVYGVYTHQNQNATASGLLRSDSFKEDGKAAFHKNGLIESTKFVEY